MPGARPSLSFWLPALRPSTRHFRPRSAICVPWPSGRRSICRARITLSLAVILAQVVALVLLGFAPGALVIGIFPSAGHDLFRAWLGKFATAVFIKALYSARHRL